MFKVLPNDKIAKKTSFSRKKRHFPILGSSFYYLRLLTISFFLFGCQNIPIYINGQKPATVLSTWVKDPDPNEQKRQELVHSIKYLQKSWKLTNVSKKQSSVVANWLGDRNNITLNLEKKEKTCGSSEDSLEYCLNGAISKTEYTGSYLCDTDGNFWINPYVITMGEQLSEEGKIIEQEFIGSLKEVKYFEIFDNYLNLFNDKGKVTLTFTSVEIIKNEYSNYSDSIPGFYNNSNRFDSELNNIHK